MSRCASETWTDLEALETRVLLDGAVEVLPAVADPGAQAAAPCVGQSVGLDRQVWEQDSSLELWRYGPDGWGLVSQEVAAGDEGGEADAPSAAQCAWYYFCARIQHGDDNWSQMRSPEWSGVWQLDNHAPTIEITSPVTAGEISLGQELPITWDAQDADGDPLDVYVWAFSWSTGWQQIGGPLDGSAGQFAWDTGAEWVTEGWYCLSAWVTDGHEWRAATSPDWVLLAEDAGGDQADSSSFSAQVVAGVLQISGTDAAETITVSVDADRMTVQRGLSTLRFTTSLSGIVIYTFDGDDVIRITHDVNVGATVYAGLGDDRIYAAGTGGDSLDGGDGDDLLITVGGGGDEARGQDGFDSFWVDSSDTVWDASSLEYSRTSVHTISSFYDGYDDGSGYPPSIPLEIAGQDLPDPEPTSISYDYKDFSGQPLFVGSPGISDVRQGYIGDCYFLASLASLTLTDVHFMEQMVTELGDGTYAVRFYSAGSAEYLRVDGELPTYSTYSYSLVYANKGPQGQIWVPIVEKAYAQFRYGMNSYESLHGGWMSTVYRQVTNVWARNYYIFNTTDAAVWNLLSQEIDQGHALTLASIGQPESPIVGGHAYTVHSIFEQDGTRYVTVHNPWGVDGRSWDDNYYDGLMTLTMSKFRACFSYVVSCQA